MNTQISIPETLKNLRKKFGYSLKEVAEKVGKSDKAVSSWETGRTKPDIDTLLKLCEIYKVESFSIFQNANRSTAPTDLRFQRLTDNYNRMNDTGKEKLASYSDDLAANPANTEKTHIYKIAARDGGVKEVELSDDQFREITDAPDWSDEK